MSRITCADVPQDYLINHLVGSFAETVKWWITGNEKYSPEEVAGFYMAVIAEQN